MAGGWVGGTGSAIGGSPGGSWVTGVGNGSVRGGRVATDSPSWTGGGGQPAPGQPPGPRPASGGTAATAGSGAGSGALATFATFGLAGATGAGLATGTRGAAAHGLHRGRLVPGHLLDLHGAGGDQHRGGHSCGGLGRNGADAGGDGAARCGGARRGGSTAGGQAGAARGHGAAAGR